jgi:D-alanyl-D-alanine carboxypeptidase (penicillin-binding protein 5/6)
MRLLKIFINLLNQIAYKKIKILIIILIVFPNFAHSFKSDAEFALLIEYETDQVLYEKNSRKKIYPASMSKLMTLYVLFDYLEKNIISLDEKIFISENAWRKGGAVSESSTMFAEVSSYISVENIIRGIVIQSGNDACIAISEAISGSEEIFADEMNSYAKKIGMNDTNFVNSTGLHNDNHYSTPLDMTILAKSLMKDFPNFYHYFSERSFTWNGIFQPNRNNLLGNNLGIDGLKTGKTSQSGYSMIVSSEKENVRLIGIVSGLSSKDSRTMEMKKLINYGQKSFRKYKLFTNRDIIKEVKVWDGKKINLNMLVSEDINLLLNIRTKRNLNAKILFNEPIIAPIKEDQIIGKLILYNDEEEIMNSNLISSENIERNNIFGRTFQKIRYLIN